MSLREELRGAVVFATRDADVDVLNRHREILNEHFILAIPPRECLDLVVNKQKLATLAMDAGVPTAKTLTVRNERDLLDVSTKVGFPCVVKPVLAMHWRGTGKWKQVGARKAFRVDSYEELLSEYLTVSSVHPDVLVQEWIPGPQTNLLIVGGYVGADSRLLGHFTARKILQSPEDFGTGCIVQSEPLPELLAPTEVLFQKLNYRGMAEVEFKQDASTGALRLIEINTRHWDQHRLGSASGLNLTWLAYQDAIGEPVGRCSLPTKTCKWIGEDAFLLHVATGLWRREVKVKAVWDWLQGTKHYALLDKHDLKPFLKSMSSVIAGLLRSAFLKLTPRKRNLS